MVASRKLNLAARPTGLDVFAMVRERLLTRY